MRAASHGLIAKPRPRKAWTPGAACARTHRRPALRHALARGHARIAGHVLAEGVAWKLAPARLFPEHWEISLDNDCILWALPPSLAQPPSSARCLMAEDVQACYGQFAAQCPAQARNAGIRGLPPGFDLEAPLREVRAGRAGPASGGPVPGRALAAIGLDEVSVCSPFAPHLPGLGRCGAHFVGLNARHIPWDYFGRSADAWMREHWSRHRPALFDRTGTPATLGPEAGCADADTDARP